MNFLLFVKYLAGAKLTIQNWWSVQTETNSKSVGKILHALVAWVYHYFPHCCISGDFHIHTNFKHGLKDLYKSRLRRNFHCAIVCRHLTNSKDPEYYSNSKFLPKENRNIKDSFKQIVSTQLYKRVCFYTTFKLI